MKNTLFLSRSKKLFVLVFLFLHCFAFNKASAQNDEFRIEVDITPTLLNKPVNYFTLGLKLPFPIPANGTIIGTINWGDGQPVTNIPFNLPSPSVKMFNHTYTQAGIHTISISFPQMSFFVLNEHMSVASRLKRVVQWGNVPNLEYACFKNANQLDDVPATLPPSITSCYKMFTNCDMLNDNHIANWNVIQVRDFRFMFAGCHNFNVDISAWVFNDHLRRVAMVGFLNYASVFNRNLNAWCFKFSKPAFFCTNSPIENVINNQPNWGGNCPQQNVPPQSPNNMELEVNIPLSKVNQSVAFFNLTLNLPIGVPFNTVIGQVDWGDGQVDNIVYSQVPNPFPFQHTYQNANIYVIKINYANLKIFELHQQGAPHLLRIKQWGKNMPFLEYATFKNAINLDDVPDNLPQTIVSCFNMFSGCKILNDNDISTWHVDNVLNFGSMFFNCQAFNVDISDWNFNNNIVRASLNNFLNKAKAFNRDLSKWCFPFAKSIGFSNEAPINGIPPNQPRWNGNCCPPPVVHFAIPGFFDVDIFWFHLNPLLNNTEVEIKINDGAAWRKVISNDVIHNFNNLIPNANYKYRIRATCNLPGTVSEYVEGEFNTLDNQIIAPTCQPPGQLVASTNSSSSVTISWQPVQDVVSYFVQVKPSYIPTWDTIGTLLLGASVPANRTYKTFDYLTPGATYNYRVRGTCSYILPNPGGNFSTGFSSEGTFTLPNSIGMPVFFEENTTEWKMYPNPATDLVNINFHLEADSEISFLVYDLTGRIVQQVRLDGFVGANEMQMNIDNLNTGVYLVKAIYGNTNRVVGRVVKQ